MKQPNLVISSLDLDRLERLLETLPTQQALNHPLQTELDRADVIEPEQMPADVVTMNSTVRFRLIASGEEHSLTLVYPKDVKGESSRISVLAPVGSALLGLKVGDNISWPGPSGQLIEVEILEVVYQPERAGELHR
ncbi:nucleoside diphosphate kinase regulator [Aeromonas simiae]|uniref:Nucleoside diphosphate kinase regulator n=1 Tax=Aeromonas simiae TaxID=218936 RepID=A0A5J6X014_9GAMM|nr:nucleoside diphosphate kinase regulator [Aeromonas simiae]MDO2948805.1 nucleoside diphosphate kinase regulator [Aeromonas simiae]MDO2953717.1 nucleoside diphosphate kinase regulator [Aeromonas simiae]MDO2956188.1 nucleoside diphosphate kinase regulator [Aeromonas simiae]QFI54915.1 nucleoside diphosphate kinase regulator [Aeromonas simiae]